MSDPFLGQIMPFAGSFCPKDWAFCDGQLLPITQNQALYSLLGTAFGGDGVSTFGLPDLRGRVCLHAGARPGASTYHRGQVGGIEGVQLQTSQIPAHTHAAQVTGSVTTKLRCTPTGGDTDDPSGANLATTTTDNYSGNAASTDMAPTAIEMDGWPPAVSVGPAGGSGFHENRQPFQVVNWCICLNGLYPSRG